MKLHTYPDVSIESLSSLSSLVSLVGVFLPPLLGGEAEAADEEPPSILEGRLMGVLPQEDLRAVADVLPPKSLFPLANQSIAP